MECQQSQSLIPSYLDGELSEAQAAPLRKHLLDCQPCRAGAQGEKNQKRWFSAKLPVSVPHGFAARVARRAFAGDTGETQVEILPAGAGGVFARSASAAMSLDRAALQSSRAHAERGASEAQLLRFVVQATAAAALLVLVLSIALRSLSLPAGSNLRAADGRNEIGVEKALERLDQMNQTERMNSSGLTGEKTRGAAHLAPRSSSDTVPDTEVRKP
jgi:anti-sigma factor RsiW